MYSRLTMWMVVAASISGTTLTRGGGAAAVVGEAPMTGGSQDGAAGSPATVSRGFELARGAGGWAGNALAEPPSDTPDASTAGDAPCHEGMLLVQGKHCYFSQQECLRWDDPEGRPQRRVCASFKRPTQCTSAQHPMRFCMDRDEFVEPREELPAVGVSWEQAREKCQAQGKRLCTNLEWEFACEGEDALPYPYGFERSPSLCNQDRVVRDGERGARGDLREPPHPSCVSPFGIRDMVGNVDEWVERAYDKPPHRSELRGGWWMTGRNRCRAATTSHDERYAGRQTGFRCCRDADL